MASLCNSRVSAWVAGTVLALAGGMPVHAQGGPVTAFTATPGRGEVVLLAQDWSDISLISSNHDWSGVPGIVGHRGDDLITLTGVDPQTVLADGGGTPINVLANLSNPNTEATGGVGEFHIANPVVALQGSGTADAPHLVLTLDTSGVSSVRVSYLLRDIDGSADNAVQPVALQYRVGGTGGYTNVPAGFVADASSGPNQAVLETLVDAVLPANANDQALVEVRVITTNAVGNDEWIGVDDILVTATPIASRPSIRITEWMYNTRADADPGEFVELTNVGDEPVDMAGWRYDDDSASYAQGFDLSGFGVVQPGESVVLTEIDAEAFRTEWNLCAGVKIVGGSGPGLGRADQINIFDATEQLVDVLTYGDNTIGGPRTNGDSGWVSAAGLGVDNVLAWTKSTVGDAEGSWASATGFSFGVPYVGSPGTSTHGGYDPCSTTPVGGQIRITEWMYNTRADADPGEFVELTNVGDEPVDMAGWRYDDDSASYAQGFDLGGFGVVQPGESVVFTEIDAEAFRTEWNLCAGVKIVGGSGPGLGRADQINIFDATEQLVDVLTYGDNTIGGPRTNGDSGWVSAAGLGVDNVLAWTKSTVGDAEGSWASATGFSFGVPYVGSPGTSTHGGYDPCGGNPGQAPTIQVSPGIQIGSIGDPSNPSALLTLADPDGDAADLVVTVLSSSNPSVLPVANVVVSGSGSERAVDFQPTGRGVSNLVFRVADLDGNIGTAALTYASSNQAPDVSGRYHHHISDASAALDVGDGHVLLVNDETNTIFLHRQAFSGPPVKTWTFTPAQLGTSSEVDFEGIARSGDLVVITGSHGNNRSGEARPERRTLVAATISGAGADTELTFLGRYNGLWNELRGWDQGDGHGLGANALGFIAGTAPGVEPDPPGGFNIEALEFSPDGQSLYLGFRAPTVDTGSARHALIVPVLNVDDLVDGAPGTGPAQFGAPILLDLDGRSIRSIASNEHGDYLISAGPTPQNPTWALYTWNGDPSTAARFNRLLPDESLLTGGPWESILGVPHPLQEGAVVRLVTDSGDTNFYGTGQTKDLPQAYQKSYSQDIVLAEVPVVEYSLSVTIQGQGQVDGDGIACPGVCEQAYPEGTAVSLVATAQAGYVFTGWSGDCTGSEACALTIDGDKSAQATFDLAPAPLLRFDPDTLAFGGIEVGGTSAAMTAVLHNDGDAAATGIVLGTVPAGFSLQSSDCAGTIAVGGSCQLALVFQPTDEGPAVATFAVEGDGGIDAILSLSGTGVIAVVPVTDVLVSIVASRDHVQPGQALDYLVTVGSLGPDDAQSTSVLSTLSPLFDLGLASWQCLGPVGSGCADAGTGDLADTGLLIPSGTSVEYLISVQVPWEGEDELVTRVEVDDDHDADPGNNVDQTATIRVLFRDGFEGDDAGDGTMLPLDEQLVADAPLELAWTPQGGDLLGTLVIGALAGSGPADAAFRVDQLLIGERAWVRLVARDADRGEYASAWLPVVADARLRLEAVTDLQSDEIIGRGELHLSIGSDQVRLPLPIWSETYRLWSVLPVAED